MPNDNVIPLDVETTLDIPVERVLAGASDLSRVMVLGWEKGGDMYFASSFSDKAQLLWLLECAKQEVME